jgi:hypothetical protein
MVLKVYEFRYQKKFVNIVKSLMEIFRFSRGSILKTLFVYLSLQVAAGLSALGFPRLAHLVSFPVPKARMEQVISEILGVRFMIAETTVGGAALDVDNEKDYIILSVMYRDWLNQISAA